MGWRGVMSTNFGAIIGSSNGLTEEFQGMGLSSDVCQIDCAFQIRKRTWPGS